MQTNDVIELDSARNSTLVAEICGMSVLPNFLQINLVELVRPGTEDSFPILKLGLSIDQLKKREAAITERFEAQPELDLIVDRLTIPLSTVNNGSHKIDITVALAHGFENASPLEEEMLELIAKKHQLDFESAAESFCANEFYCTSLAADLMDAEAIDSVLDRLKLASNEFYESVKRLALFAINGLSPKQ